MLLHNFVLLQLNNIEELVNAFQTAKMVKDMPTAIIAKTIKGKGVSYMENQVGSICKLLLSTITHRLSNLCFVDVIAASHT